MEGIKRFFPLFMAVSIALAIVVLLYMGLRLAGSEKSAEEVREGIVSTPLLQNPEGALVINNADYQISYSVPIDRFTISVKGTPFEDARKKAEEHFLVLAGSDKTAICQLNVRVVQLPPDPQNPRDPSGLNFCK